MKSTLDCIPCFVEHSMHVAKMVAGDDEVQQLDIVRLCLGKIAAMDMSMSPPEMARILHSIIRNITGVEDPYRELKDRSTDFALELLPELRDDIVRSDDKFETIVRFVIAGNIIDFGANRHFDLATAHHSIREVLTMSLDRLRLEHLKQQMESAKTILYMADNCGEAVFDRLLIEPYREKITLGVRGRPILNDITPREVAMSGLSDLAGGGIVDTGDAMPGVSLKHSSDEFLEVFHGVDLIIAKGQGNFESLSGSGRPVFFLFRVKCPVIASLVDAEMDSLQIVSENT